MPITLNGTTGITTPGLTNTGSETISSGTANGVTYLNGSKVLTSGSALTFDGTNLGVGTSSPSAKLYVLNSSGVTLTLEKSGGASIQFVNSGGNGYQIDDSSGAMRWLSGGSTERMRLDSSGNLGIGTSSPKEKLDSRGAAVFSGDNATGTNAFGTASGLLLSTSSDNTKARITAVSNGANSISLVLRSLSSGSAVDAVTIDPSGNLGIGTTSPGALLHTYTATQESVRFARNSTASSAYVTFYANNSSSAQVQYAGILGDVASSTAGSHGGNLLFYTTGSGTSAERARITSGGDFGIGTSSPAEKLSVSGTNISAAIYDSGMSVGGNKTRVKLGVNNNYCSGLSGYVAAGQPGIDRVNLGFHVTTYTSSLQTFYEAMTLTDAGRLGIGTTNPTGGFTNVQTTSQLSSGASNSVGVWTVSNKSNASNNATVDVLRLLNANSSLLNGYISGHVYIVANGASGADGYSAVYSLITTSNGTSNATFSLVSSVTRGTSPVASVAIANDGGSGAVKVQVTWINNSGVVTGGACNASFVGLAS